MGVVKAALGDAALTFLWVFSVPMLGISSRAITAALGFTPVSVVGLFITTGLATVLVLIFSVIGNALGGASFNPTTSASLYAAGVRPDSSILSFAVRFPAQAAAGLGGAWAILRAMPSPYKNMLVGPFLKVDPHTGAIAEGILTFALNLAVLFIFLRGPKSPLLKVWLLALTTVVLVLAGSGYTGPSMNPANAFGWAYLNKRHNTWEHFYVYWLSPLIGAISAAWVFQLLFPPPPKKQKKA